MRDLFRGKLVRLTGESPETLAGLEMRWQTDTEYHRLADDEPAILWSARKNIRQLEKRIGKEEADYFFFSIRTLDTDALIGVTMLRVDWVDADAIAGIAIGDRLFWGRGYGTDAMRLLVQYAFLELNLRRVTLGVNAFNGRARRSYEKVGFRKEGTYRAGMLRDGQRADSIYMGILHEEWQSLQGGGL